VVHRPQHPRAGPRLPLLASLDADDAAPAQPPAAAPPPAQQSAPPTEHPGHLALHRARAGGVCIVCRFGRQHSPCDRLCRVLLGVQHGRGGAQHAPCFSSRACRSQPACHAARTSECRLSRRSDPSEVSTHAGLVMGGGSAPMQTAVKAGESAGHPITPRLCASVMSCQQLLPSSRGLQTQAVRKQRVWRCVCSTSCDPPVKPGRTSRFEACEMSSAAPAPTRRRSDGTRFPADSLAADLAGNGRGSGTASVHRT
jgi:hypothetical protein